ncbi:MAG: cytochrome c oxidase subunit 3 [Chitinophagaceae bacterium]|nr:cytochrome c oxidase subunit 3 [Chitinophagaceae bacterium]
MISESVLRGYYTLIVQKILTSGMVLFLASEAMFFFGFF